MFSLKYAVGCVDDELSPDPWAICAGNLCQQDGAVEIIETYDQEEAIHLFLKVIKILANQSRNLFLQVECSSSEVEKRIKP